MEERLFENNANVEERIRDLAEKEEPDLIRIRRELHKVPELGVELPETYEMIRRELQKIPGMELIEHAAEGYGLIGIMHGKLPHGKTVLLRADIDALPVEEPEGHSCRSEHPGCMHACGHDGHATWLIGAARILSAIRDSWGGCVKFVFQPGEEVGQGARALIEKDHVLENPKVDMAFAAHGWPSVESGKIGIARRYAFGCVGGFSVKITGKKGHASWPEETFSSSPGESFPEKPASPPPDDWELTKDSASLSSSGRLSSRPGAGTSPSSCLICSGRSGSAL